MRITETIKAALGGFAIAAVAASGLATPSFAQQQYIPGIWVDPDGCEHWVMDDGAEGFMSPHRRRDGSPVCHRAEICGIMPTDQFFATDRYDINAANRQRLQEFFRNANAFGYLIYGHTDERASDEYNMVLSQNRANSVAQVAQTVGARVVDVRGFGERQPRVQGHSEEAWRQNRRVEVYCLR
ncbi:OmpA family protein [Wenxinia marina]|uniref:Outer membrane protein n=1 Tax=Wenxinia marina DSM 24838 TaxID=1123501 RepID=A0A0D0Q4U8_9RHOB|nr:Outer membrane protein [Wenxinia marina DSM 24838]GGL68492.1 hypothetical protein GCM10011392_23750 [Wenxinia marina]